MTIIIPRLLLLLAIFASQSEARASQGLQVQLPHGGWLLGRHRTTHSGRHMRAFMGIPYALPPLGELRFRPPIPQPGWEGERLALKDAPICMQRDPFRRDMLIEGSEDCLYLNVYTPDPVEIAGDKLLPVMVWFHGGGWQCGSGISSFYGPDFLLDHNIVLVSANFRLGPLGFLSTETLDCPGNNGLKDQLQVLRWIRDNVAAFGGDPQQVTVFGESAGGASVTYHMLSPQSRGLLHRGIAQSGTYYNPWAQPAHKGVAAKRAAKLTQLVDCDAAGEDWAAKLKCLRSKPAEQIVATLYDMFLWDFDPMIPFPPVIEPQHDDAFLTELPRETSAPPHGQQLPLMLGVTSEEGLLKTAALLNLPQLLSEFKTRFEQLLPVVLNYDHHANETQQQITQHIETFYFKAGHNYNKSNHQNLTDLISDGWFVAGVDEYLQMRLQDKQQSVAPTYVYLFDHKGAASFSELFKGGHNEFYGACHAEELQYLFPIGQELFVSAVPTRQDLQLRELMLRLWVNFASSGDPNPVIGTSNLPSWLPASSYPVTYARLGTKLDLDADNDELVPPLLRMEAALLQHRVDFWRQLKAHLPAHRRSSHQHNEL
ncbi:LOW QUALITY PROTEIN: venom carboxylesterase-6 [Drosophila nasuta]|uniref:LOW QUALITY PROTEIN: venom carboxylesterase-6 n=1 Tax=Drosophila nasuta TaxID=42062 RepID=UPI00295E2D08|nr:LOW QUALITY PROTEIN: venom carboxylesterase-6 [Drosophila nasuta]